MSRILTAANCTSWSFPGKVTLPIGYLEVPGDPSINDLPHCGGGNLPLSVLSIRAGLLTDSTRPNDTFDMDPSRLAVVLQVVTTVDAATFGYTFGITEGIQHSLDDAFTRPEPSSSSRGYLNEQDSPSAEREQIQWRPSGGELPHCQNAAS